MSDYYHYDMDRRRCEFCGRFMKHHWAQSNDHEDSWYDWWDCGQIEKHKREHPEMFWTQEELDEVSRRVEEMAIDLAPYLA